MKITKKYLRQVIKEELDGVMEASDIPDRQKNASGVTSEMALIAKLRDALQGRKDEVKPNEYDTLWVAIEVILDLLATGNVDTALSNANLRRGLELIAAANKEAPAREPGPTDAMTFSPEEMAAGAAKYGK